MRRILLIAALVTALLGFGPVPEALGAGSCASKHRWDSDLGPLQDREHGSPGDALYLPNKTETGNEGLAVVPAPLDPYEEPKTTTYTGGGTFSADVRLDVGVRACRELQYGVTVYEWVDTDGQNDVDPGELEGVLLDVAVRGAGDHVKPPPSYETDGDLVTIVVNASISADYAEECLVAVARVRGAGHDYATSLVKVCDGAGGQYWY